MMTSELEIKETYSWRDDILRIQRETIEKMDNARINQICQHYECDLSEFRQWLSMKRKRALDD